MPVTRSRLRAHAVEWHVAPAPYVDARHRAVFLEVQRRCNSEICRHAALTHNRWLDAVESRAVFFESLLRTLQQLAIFLRQVALVRERHALMLSEGHAELENQAGTAVVICFDENGVPWCPPLPGLGLGDPYAFSERLNNWWTQWQVLGPQVPDGWSLRQSSPATRNLCDMVEVGYNAVDLSTGIGVMMAVENSLSTDLWQRLGRALRARCEENGKRFPDAGFFPVAETHARLQARHSLYLLEATCVGDKLDEAVFFRASEHALMHLGDFWKVQGEAVQQRH